MACGARMSEGCMCVVVWLTCQWVMARSSGLGRATSTSHQHVTVGSQEPLLRAGPFEGR